MFRSFITLLMFALLSLPLSAGASAQSTPKCAKFTSKSTCEAQPKCKWNRGARCVATWG
jgi:hypothetical protein